MYTNSEPVPFTLFPNIYFNITDAAYANVDYFSFEIINNCSDTCTFNVLKGRDESYKKNNTWKGSDFKVYPNPASHTVTIESTQSGKYKLMDLQGIAKHEETIEADSNIQLNVRNYPPGAYIIFFTNEVGETIHQKLIIN